MVNKTIFVSAGEVSGDIHAADLIKKIKEMDPSVRFVGMGGPNMAAAGMTSISEDVSTLSSEGFVESARFLKKKFSLLLSGIRYIINNGIKYLLLIDNQGFNIPLAKRAKKTGTTNIYYFPPHVSVWGKWNARVMARNIDLIIVPFYQDYLIYKEYKGNAVFSGHPLLDKAADLPPLKEIYEKYGFDGGKKIVSIMPGSRHQEIEALTSPMLKAAKMLIEKHGIKVILPISHPDFEKIILKKIKKHGLENKIKIIRNDSWNAVRMADVNIMASGTASLESALLRRPPVICYKISWLTYLIGRIVIKDKMIGLPNILLKKKFFPELLQRECRPDNMVKETLAFLYPDEDAKQNLETCFNEIRKSLGDEKVVERVAKMILERISYA